MMTSKIWLQEYSNLENDKELTCLHNNPKVIVVIVNWNGLKFLEDCFNSLKASSYSNADVLFIDNHSSDDSIVFASQHPLKPQVLQLPRNEGFASGCNNGIRACLGKGAKYIALLNNDTRVDADWLDALVAVADSDPKIGACGSKQLSWDGQQEVQLKYIPQWADSEMTLANSNVTTENSEKLFVSGFSMLLRTSAVTEVGAFDDRYFAGNEDLDLCLRLWIAGYSVVQVPGSRVYHRLGGSSNTKLRMRWGYRNQLYTIFKNYQVPTIRRYIPQILKRWIFTRNRFALLASLKALLNTPSTLAMRRKIQTGRIFSDEEIFQRVGIEDFSR